MLLSQVGSKGCLRGMGERTVAHVVQKCCGAYQHLILFLQAEMVREQVSQMIGPQAVLEASVIGTGVDKARQAELLDPAQSLHLGRVCDFQGKALQQNVAVHGVTDLCHLA